MASFNFSKYHETFFNIVIVFNYVVYIVTFLGLYNFSPKLLEDFHFYFQLYICLFLIVHFFPFRKVRFEKVDQRIAFSSGVIILSTVILNQLPIAQNVVQKIKNVKDKVMKRDSDELEPTQSHITKQPYLTTTNTMINTNTNTIPYPTQTLGY
jgi:hypothetical protein